jgi:hypothetical protein
MPKRIDFMIAGVQKGGTTSLDAYLRQHPDISMAKKKEVHFFDKRPPTGIRPLDYWIYHQQFHWNEKARGAKLGEATPILTWWTGAMERLWRYNPHIKVIMLLRDPVERAWSHFRMDKRLQREGETFSNAIRTERERARRSLPGQDRERSQVSRGSSSCEVKTFRPARSPNWTRSLTFSAYRVSCLPKSPGIIARPIAKPCSQKTARCCKMPMALMRKRPAVCSDGTRDRGASETVCSRPRRSLLHSGS